MTAARPGNQNPQRLAAAQPLVERDRAGGGDVQRLGGPKRRNRHQLVALSLDFGGQSSALGAEHEDGAVTELDVRQPAAAARIGAPPFRGPAPRHRESATGRGSYAGRSARRKTAISRAGCGSVETSASNSAETVSPATSSSTGSNPASRPAATRSSPSATNRPSFSRCRADASFRTNLSR